MRPERRFKGRNGKGRLRPPQRKSDPPIHNLLKPEIGLDNGVHFSRILRGLGEHHTRSAARWFYGATETGPSSRAPFLEVEYFTSSGPQRCRGITGASAIVALPIQRGKGLLDQVLRRPKSLY